tara:strand:- start:378 stop:560 length:183 start_codon:yes stop_codon:yes gene_type:complete
MEGYDIMDRQGYMAIFIAIFRVGACYGLWLQDDIMFKTIGVLFAIAEVLNLLAKVDKWEG